MTISTWRSDVGEPGYAAFHQESYTFPHVLQMLLFYCDGISCHYGSTRPFSVTSALSLPPESPEGTAEVDIERMADFTG